MGHCEGPLCLQVWALPQAAKWLLRAPGLPQAGPWLPRGAAEREWHLCGGSTVVAVRSCPGLPVRMAPVGPPPGRAKLKTPSPAATGKSGGTAARAPHRAAELPALPACSEK